MYTIIPPHICRIYVLLWPCYYVHLTVICTYRNGKPRKTEETSIGREIWEYVKMIAIVVAVVVFVEQVIVINARIPSPSMENTIMTGDQIFGNRLAYVKSDPQRYDIVIFYYPDDEKQKFIKRVIGLPGETVTLRDGKVYINDSTEPLCDDFCPETPVGDFGP